MATSEETPLLKSYNHEDHRPQPSEAVSEHELVYQRFSSHQKRIILTIVSLCALLPLFMGISIYPAFPEMVKDFHSTPQVIGLAVSISVFSASIGAVMAASCSTFYGRRPIFLCALPLLIFGSLGVSLSQTVGELFFFRMCQALGASPGFSSGAGVIGDIYKIEERGTAMGVFIAAMLVGPVIAPVAGGLAVQYASWRVMQLIVGAIGLVVFGIIWFYMPETSHPGARGIDKLRLKAESGVRIKWTNYLVNPFAPLGLLRAPNVLAVTLVCCTGVLTWFVLLVPLAYTIGAKYNIKNTAFLGACAIPTGIGEMVGAPLSGRLSDRIVVRSRRARGGIWYPEDRLRAAFIGALIFIPLPMILSGIVTEYVEGPIGLVLDLVLFFLNGFGLQLVLSPASAYIVDILHSRSAEAAAIVNGFRSFILAFAISGIMPMIDTYGMMITNVASAAVAWFGFMLLWLTIQHGEAMRAWCDIEFSTAENN